MILYDSPLKRALSQNADPKGQAHPAKRLRHHPLSPDTLSFYHPTLADIRANMAKLHFLVRNSPCTNTGLKNPHFQGRKSPARPVWTGKCPKSRHRERTGFHGTVENRDPVGQRQAELRLSVPVSHSPLPRQPQQAEKELPNMKFSFAHLGSGAPVKRFTGNTESGKTSCKVFRMTPSSASRGHPATQC